MKTAVDSSVLWCLLIREPDAEAWNSLLLTAAEEGDLVICPVVLAEIAPAYTALEKPSTSATGVAAANSLSPPATRRAPSTPASIPHLP